jgi:uncharacterized protein YkwD
MIHNLEYSTSKSNLVKVAMAVCLCSIMMFMGFLYQLNNTYDNRKIKGVFSSQELLAVINRERSNRGIQPLIINKKLEQAAQKKADDMSSKSYFSHISTVDGKEWKNFILESGYEYKEAGENLANGYDTVEEVVEAWLLSPSHRQNLLNKNVSETGFGVKKGLLDGYPTVFAVEMFGEEAQKPVNTFLQD